MEVGPRSSSVRGLLAFAWTMGRQRGLAYLSWKVAPSELPSTVRMETIQHVPGWDGASHFAVYWPPSYLRALFFVETTVDVVPRKTAAPQLICVCAMPATTSSDVSSVGPAKTSNLRFADVPDF